MSRAPGLRIGAGSLKGRRLEVPRGARPTGARLREAVLGIWGERIAGANLLDLYAGSGALGLEGISRGAARATFVESAPPALAALRRNLKLAPPDRSRLVAADALAGLAKLRGEGVQFDLLFADPPYDLELEDALAEALAAVAAPGASWILERRRRGGPPPASGAWSISDQRRYGDSEIAIHERRSSALSD